MSMQIDQNSLFFSNSNLGKSRSLNSSSNSNPDFPIQKIDNSSQQNSKQPVYRKAKEKFSDLLVGDNDQSSSNDLHPFYPVAAFNKPLLSDSSVSGRTTREDSTDTIDTIFSSISTNEENKSVILPRDNVALLGIPPIEEIDLISENEPPENVFKEKGYNINTKLNSGSFGTTYEITSSQGKVSVCKILRNPQPLRESSKFWRHGDFAASRLELPNLVKLTAYLINIEFSDGKKGRFYLPANKIKELGQSLPTDVKVSIEAEVMEKAPGESLEKLLENKTIDLQPGGPHFNNIIKSVHEFLRSAYDHNFIHRDLKPANVMYDPTTGKVTIIDIGEASRLRRRNKSDHEVKGVSNPMTSKKQQGSRNYMAPAMFQSKEYGSEVDYFSAGMFLLKIISPEDFKTFNKSRGMVTTFNDLLFDQEPSKILDIYLEKIGPESTTNRALVAHQELKEIINLYFQVAARETPEEVTASNAALERLDVILRKI